MKDLDKIIETSFTDAPLPSGHRERFLKRLPRKNNRRSLLLAALSAAAIIILSIMLFNPTHEIPQTASPDVLSMYIEQEMLPMKAQVLLVAKERLPEPDYLELKQGCDQVLEELKKLEQLKSNVSQERYNKLVQHQIKISADRMIYIAKYINR